MVNSQRMNPTIQFIFSSFFIHMFQVGKNEWLGSTTRWRQMFLLPRILPPGSPQRQTTARCLSQTSRLLNDLHLGCAQIKSVSLNNAPRSSRRLLSTGRNGASQSPSDRGEAGKQVRPPTFSSRCQTRNTGEGSEVTNVCGQSS